jgi:O-antigen biosynthesis protein
MRRTSGNVNGVVCCDVVLQVKFINLISYRYKRHTGLHISIIIVNYNVKYFLEQCLHSVYDAMRSLQVEVWVVDNASTDESVPYLQAKFPWLNWILNNDNVGFARANNQALIQCRGKYVLYLNPDTIIPEDCLEKCFAFMEQHADAGSLGIRMVDGSGKFLPESKRSFPSPVTSFFKLIGLSSLFPNSKLFARYALGYLDEHKNHEVDVLAGAFMMCRRDVLQQLHGFDDTFFMYGEDIDLSYRTQKAGYKNYYFSGSEIIHFKGESTRKGSLNYVRMFYNAMSIFVKKHYGGSKARVFNLLIQLAIILRGAASAIVNGITKIGLPLIDAVIIFGSFQLVNAIWIRFVREGHEFIPELVNISLPGFTIVFLLAATLAGIYDNKYKPRKALYAAVVAIIVMLAVYSLLPERYRFSRGVILFGGLTALLGITVLRALLRNWRMVEDDDEEKREKQTLIVGTSEEYNEVQTLLERAGLQNRVMGRVATNGVKEEAVVTLSELPPLLQAIDIREIIFSKGHLTYKDIIRYVQQLPDGICVRFHAHGSYSIVGSDSKDTSGEFVSIEGRYQLAHPYQKRMKRIVDITVALFILLTFPVHVFVTGINSIVNAFVVLIGKKTWIGYNRPVASLPKIPAGVLSSTGDLPSSNNADDKGQQVDDWYARYYHWPHDVKTIIKHYSKLGA